MALFTAHIVPRSTSFFDLGPINLKYGLYFSAVNCRFHLYATTMLELVCCHISMTLHERLHHFEDYISLENILDKKLYCDLIN